MFWTHLFRALSQSLKAVLKVLAFTILLWDFSCLIIMESLMLPGRMGLGGMWKRVHLLHKPALGPRWAQQCVPEIQLWSGLAAGTFTHWATLPTLYDTSSVFGVRVMSWEMFSSRRVFHLLSFTHFRLSRTYCVYLWFVASQPVPVRTLGASGRLVWFQSHWWL